MILAILIALSSLSLWGQDIKLEVFKDEWQFIPLFALEKQGALKTILKKQELELLVNGQNTRDFVLHSCPLNRVNDAAKDKDKEPRLNDITINLFFDNRTGGAAFLQESLNIAREIVRNCGPGIYFKIMTASGVNIGPLQDKRDVLTRLKRINFSITQGEKGFKSLYHWAKKSRDLKIVYIFQKRIPKKNLNDSTPLGYLEHLDAPVFYLSPGKTLQETQGTIGTISHGRYFIGGNVREMVSLIGELLGSFYIMRIPALKDLENPGRAVSLGSLNKTITLYTSNRISTTSTTGNKSTSPQKTKNTFIPPITLEKPDSTGPSIHKILEELSQNRDRLKKEAAKFLLSQSIIYINQGNTRKAMEALSKIKHVEDTPLTFMDNILQQLSYLHSASSKSKELTGLTRRIFSLLKKEDFESAGELLATLFEKNPKPTKDTEEMIQIISRFDEKRAESLVISHNRAFTPAFRKKFYQSRLLKMGIDDGLLNESIFIEVVIFAREIDKNSKGYWQGLFPNDTIMIFIPPGAFSMGLPWESGGAQDESPVHEVRLDGYWIAKFETTFQQFDNYCRDRRKGRPDGKGFGRKRRPVINVSWYDAGDYCRWLSQKTGIFFSLPSEAQWEKAARGPVQSIYPWGNPTPTGKRANFADINLYDAFVENNPGADKSKAASWIDKKSDDGYTHTSPVGKYPDGSSHFGVMDMAGNVWEFVLDWDDGDYYTKSPKTNPGGPSYETSFKVIRGGGWDSHHWMLRATTRAAGVPDKGSDVLGFRVAISQIYTPGNNK